jgi:hypothetical protein
MDALTINFAPVLQIKDEQFFQAYGIYNSCNYTQMIYVLNFNLLVVKHGYEMKVTTTVIFAFDEPKNLFVMSTA